MLYFGILLGVVDLRVDQISKVNLILRLLHHLRSTVTLVQINAKLDWSLILTESATATYCIIDLVIDEVTQLRSH